MKKLNPIYWIKKFGKNTSIGYSIIFINNYVKNK
jgi:hypothetical protein